LNRGVVDVALIARDHPWPGLPLERGTTCMVRARVPIAVVESAHDNVVDACRRAVSR
jgi:hypothetical protein